MTKIRTPEPEGFADFWAAWMPYRRKNDGRGEARDCYRKHILAGAEPQDILDGAKAYLRKLTAQERAYIPLAATWLNREAYLDYADEQREYERRAAELGARKSQPPNVVNFQPETKQPDSRPSEEERRAQVARLLGPFAAQG